MKSLVPLATAVLLAALAPAPAVRAQLTAAQIAACGCDHVQPNTGNTAWIFNGATTPVAPGDRICLQPEQRTLLAIHNVHGTADAPITVANCGGKTLIEQTAAGSYGMRVIASSHLRVTGTGDAAHEHGIEIRGRTRDDAPTMGLFVGGLSHDVEADHLEIHRTGFAGIMAKTDPNCDPATWRENFHMGRVHLHHNRIYETGGEGFYVGYFRAVPFEITCGGAPTTVTPHLIDPLLIHDNEVFDTDADGIQVSNAPGRTEVYRNTVRNYGADPFENFQNSGFQIGAGVSGLVYDNIIDTGSGTGMGIFGTGHMVVYNNLIVDAGELGIFSDDRDPSVGPGVVFAHNTIVAPAGDGFRLYTERHPETVLYNNLVVAPGSGRYVHRLSGNVAVAEAGNVYLATRAEAGFAGADDYRPMEGAAPVDGGVAMGPIEGLFSYFDGIPLDLAGQPRISGAAPDAGAYEFAAAVPVELAAFAATVEATGALLTWRTEGESGNAGFHVEHRRPDAAAFDEVAFVDGAGTTAEPQDYAFRVPGLDVGVHRFRLRQVDLDGTVAFGPEVEVFVEAGRTLYLAAYPNPAASGSGTVAVALDRRQPLRVEVFDALGRRVAALHDGAASPERVLHLPLPELAPGPYVVRASAGAARVSRRITVTR